MIPIIVCGNPLDHSDRLTSSLCKSFKNYGSALLYTKFLDRQGKIHDSMKTSGKDVTPKFAIYDLPLIPDVFKINGLLVFKNSFISNDLPINIDGLTPIVDEQNKTAISILKRTGSSVISCGMAYHNTLSIASIDYSSAVVSLQRNIKTLTGNVLEPHDFPVYFNKRIDLYSLLASSAILLLSNVDSSNGFYL